MSEIEAKRVSAEYLSGVGMTFETLVGEIEGLTDASTALLVGSIPRGHGSALSDIDVMLLGSPPPQQSEGGISFVRRAVNTLFRLQNDREVNLRWCSEASIAELGAKMTLSRECLTQGERFPEHIRLATWEYSTIHELRIGVPLYNENIASNYRARLRSDELPDHCLLLNLDKFRALRCSAERHALAGDEESAIWLLQGALGKLATAELSLHGETDYRGKWLLKYLHRYRDRLGDDVHDNYLRYICHPPAADPSRWLASAYDFADMRSRDITDRRREVVALSYSGIGVAGSR